MDDIEGFWLQEWHHQNYILKRAFWIPSKDWTVCEEGKLEDQLENYSNCVRTNDGWDMYSGCGDKGKKWILDTVLDSHWTYQWIIQKLRKNKGEFEVSNLSIQMYDDTNFWNGKTNG